MTTPGVGPVVALTYRATVDVPARFHKSKAIGAVFGLTCSKSQSGEIDRSGRITGCSVARTQRRGRRSCPHRHRIRTGLFEPKSPLRGNGIFRAETKRPKRPWRFKDAGAETKSRQATPPIRG